MTLIINRLQMFIKIKLSVHKKLKSTPEQNLEPVETLTLLKRLLKTPKEKAEPLEDLADSREFAQTPKETGTNRW